jgi:hypothetical protein
MELAKMTKPEVRIYTGDGQFIDREMNDEEYAQWEIDQATVTAEAKAKAKLLADKAALLDRLGITQDEAKLLLS